jgi:hypothetical protein
MKQPNWKPALILSTSLFVIGSFAYWLQYSYKPKKETAEQDLKKPLAFAADTVQIAGFRLKTASSLIEAECSSLGQKTCKVGTTGEWKVTHPEKLAGDSESIRDFLNNLSTMNASETIDLSEETQEKRSKMLEEYGLNEAKRAEPGAEFLELRLEDGKKIAAWFGSAHPFEDKVYVAASTDGRMNDKKIFLIANFYRTSVFGKTLTSFRDKTIFKFDRHTIESFDAKTPQGTVRAAKSGGLWTVNGLPADDDRIMTILIALSQAKVKEFPAVDASKGARSLIRYTLRPKGAPELSLELLSKKGPKPNDAETHYLRTPSLQQVVEVEGNLKVQLDRSLSYLRRNLLLTLVEKAFVTRLKVEGKAYPAAVEFRQDGNVWTPVPAPNRLNGQMEKWDPEKLKTLLDQMATSHSPGIVAPAPGPKQDSVTITFGDEKNASKSRYEIYLARSPGAKKGTEKAFARDLNSPRNEAYELEDGLRNLVPFRPDSWKVK